MIPTVRAVVQNGRIEPTQQIDAPEGTRVLVTLLLEDDAEFWMAAGSDTIHAVWHNTEDDRYAELLET